MYRIFTEVIKKTLIRQYWTFAISNIGGVGNCLTMKLGNLHFNLAKSNVKIKYEKYRMS